MILIAFRPGDADPEQSPLEIPAAFADIKVESAEVGEFDRLMEPIA